MRSTLWLAFGFFLLLATPPLDATAQEDTAQARPAPSGVGEPQEERLRAEILHRFLGRASHELELSEEQRGRFEHEFRGIQEKRRSLIAEQHALRRRLTRLAAGRATSDTSDEEARELLRRAGELKVREAELWREEQERLGRILSPRQHVRFLMMQERFAQRVRDMRRRPSGFDRRRPRPERRPGLERPPDRRRP